jgi:hypothetical protein
MTTEHHMQVSRRDFLDHVASGALALSLPPISRLHDDAFLSPPSGGEWDSSWITRLTGRVRAVFDVPAIESGYGVWRASLWARQYETVLGVSQRETSTALVLRHDAAALALTQSFWDRYDIGSLKRATHPLSEQPTTLNPALLGIDAAIPAPYHSFTLPNFMAAGGIALVCDVALRDIAAAVQFEDGLTPADAYGITRDALLPGTVLQPSGVFAALRAQQAGALYIRAT